MTAAIFFALASLVLFATPSSREDFFLTDVLGGWVVLLCISASSVKRIQSIYPLSIYMFLLFSFILFSSFLFFNKKSAKPTFEDN